VAALLKDEKPNVREAAADTLGMMGDGAAPFAADLLVLLRDDDRLVRRHASEALAKLAKAGVPTAAKVATLLGDGKTEVRHAALDALGEMGNVAAPFADDIAAFLKNDSVNLRSAASVALSLIQAPLGPAAPKQDVPEEDDSNLIGTAAYALAQLSKEGAEGIQRLATLISEEKTRGIARHSAFMDFLDANGNPGGKLDLQTMLLGAVNEMPAADTPRLRAHLRLWAGANPDMQLIVTWLGKPDMEPMPKEGLSAEETRATLRVFLQLWDHTETSAELRQELAGRIAQVAKAISGKPDAETAKILNGLSTKLKDQPGAAHDEVESALQR
jgi:hypothetical protein